MQNFQIGLLNCVLTKRMDRCITVLLGHIQTDDRGPLEVWGNFSEAGLLSLQQDFQQPMREGKGYEIGQGTCCVTGQERQVIKALVGIVPEITDGQPTGRRAYVKASLSWEGIEQLLGRLRADQSNPLNLQPLTEATDETPYGWVVRHKDGQIVAQYDGVTDKPRPFSEVRLADVEVFVIEPRDLLSDLPRYRLYELGFERKTPEQTLWETLPLPVPQEPFHWHYYRRVTVTFLGRFGTGHPMTPRIVQVLGWRVVRPEGDLICELGVEEDGSWTIYRRGRFNPDGSFYGMLEDEFRMALAAGEIVELASPR